ncbi:MAG: hypothetical protein M1821_003526 [Bathelium mastoideum]|nr:MAG: hypothetical protein M1821_003526 [Bathelium mastoideum]
MVLDKKTENILENPDLGSIEHELSHCATQLALLGEVDLARELASELLIAGPVGGRRILNKQLNFAWAETGLWPEGIPEEEKSEQSLSELSQIYEGNWGVGVQDESLRTYDEKGLQACLKEGDQFADASTGSSAMAKSQRLVKALDISLRVHPIKDLQKTESDDRKTKKLKGSAATDAGEELGQLRVSDLDKQSAEIVNQIVARWGANQQITYLAEAHPLWPLYLRGVLADAMDVKPGELKNKGKKLVEAFSERLKNPAGSSQVSSMTMKELLDLADNNTVNGAGKDHWSDAGDEPPKTLLKDPASKKEISDLEKKLETTLPNDYKEFLSITNGLGGGIGDGIYNGYFPDPALHATTDTKWVEEEYFQLPVELIDIPKEISDLVPAEKRTTDNGALDWDTPFPLFDRVLEIGVRDIDNLWLVHPNLVNEAREVYLKMHQAASKEQKKVLERAIEAFAGSMDAFKKPEWCCVKWSSGGAATMESYSSFRKYLESVTLDSQETK